MDGINDVSQEASNLVIEESHTPPTPNGQQAPSHRPRAYLSRGPVAQDITTKFTEAASALATGELVKDEYFTLFESVGALEIMDPKMDSGYLAPGETLEDDYDVLRDLSAEEVVGIMDQMLCYEMAWHMGYPLAQSLFTSLYIDRLLWPEPKTLDQARFDRDNAAKEDKGLLHLVLRAFCLGLIKTCDSVHQRVSTEHYYEEEDLVLSLYNRNLLSNFAVEDILRLLNEAQAFIETDLLDLSPTLKHALTIRLEVRLCMLMAVDVDKSSERGRADDWGCCIAILPDLKETRPCGKPVESSFSAKLQRKLASTVPPRLIVKITFDEAWDLLNRICGCGRDAYLILDYHGGSRLQNFLWSFQSRTPQPPAYIRCLLQSLIFSEMKVLNSLSIKQLLLDDLQEISLPADPAVDDSNWDIEVPQDPRFQLARQMDGFIHKAADAYIDSFRTLCMNRSRLRRMLCHLVLEFDSLQLSAETTDIALRQYNNEPPLHSPPSEESLWSFPLSAWAYHHKLLQLTWIVQMGFELSIYSPPELGGQYWYLSHLTQTRIAHLERTRTFTTHRLSSSLSPATELTPEAQATVHRSLSHLDFSILEAHATSSLASALSALYSFLAHISLLPKPYAGSDYSSPPLRYALRMRPFGAISLPDLPTYEEFIANVSIRPDPNASEKKLEAQAMSVLNVAERGLKAARRDWERVGRTSAEVARVQGCEGWWAGGVRDVVRSCIKAGIGVAVAKRVVGQCKFGEVREKLKVKIGGEGEEGKGKGYHAWWTVPEITAVS